MQPGRRNLAGLSLYLGLSVVEEDAVEHGEDDALLGGGEAAEALELALEFGRGAAFPGRRVGRCPGDPEQRVGGDAKEGGELGHEHDGEPEAADLIMGERLLGDAKMRGHGVLGEAGLLAQRGEAAAERFPELSVGGGHVWLPRKRADIHGRGLEHSGGIGRAS